MFESSMMFTITDYAMNRSGKLHGTFQHKVDYEVMLIDCSPHPTLEHEPKMWDNLKAQFLNHLDEVNSDLKAAGLPLLGAPLPA